MNTITDFSPAFAHELPESHAILRNAGLRVHAAVDRITLHGSRGPKGGARPDSDLDLCLLVSGSRLAVAPSQETLLRAVFEATRQHWRSDVKLDLAAVFDKSHCGLLCFAGPGFHSGLCRSTVGCLGFYKIQKGFTGFVSGPAVDCSKIHPFIEVWSRTEQ